MKENDKHSARQSNFELLRIISMCMIIAMHYMTKGMDMPKLSVDNGLHNIAFRLIFAFMVSAVNIYVFISGYFAVDSKWSVGKLIRLWLQVLFYSILVPVVLSIFGLADISSMGLGMKQQIFLPISYEHYWFASSYVMLYLFSPVLTIAIDKLDKKQLGATIAVLVMVFCGFKSVNPYLIPWDKYGDDVVWFLVLFLIAGYIRKYGIPMITSGRKGAVVYILFSLFTFFIAFAVSFIVRVTGKMEYYMDMTNCYNYVTVLIASIGLFIAFSHIDIKPNKWINRIAGYTFGVYLLHENIVLRELWPHLLGIDAAQGQWWQIFHMLICIVILFAAGCAVDALRTLVFDKVGKR